jgi:phosphate transport system permease protein
VTTSVRIDPARVDRSYIEGTNFDQMIAEAVLARLGGRDDPEGLASGRIRQLLSPALGPHRWPRVRENPDLIGQNGGRCAGPRLATTADLFLKDEIVRTCREAERRTVDDAQIRILESWESEGLSQARLQTPGLFTRTGQHPAEIEGVLGAVRGPLMDPPGFAAGLAVP